MKLPTLAADAQDLLEQFAQQLDDLGVVVPPSQYVGSGIIAWDGESLTVTLGTIGQGQPGMPIGTTFIPGDVSVMWATFYVQIIRIAPALSGEGFTSDLTPSPETLGGAGQEAVNDGRALVQAAIAIHASYSATGPGEGFVIGPLMPLGPEGGLSAMRLQIDVSLA